MVTHNVFARVQQSEYQLLDFSFNWCLTTNRFFEQCLTTVVGWVGSDGGHSGAIAQSRCSGQRLMWRAMGSSFPKCGGSSYSPKPYIRFMWPLPPEGVARLRSMTGVTGVFRHTPHMPQKTQMDFNQQRRAGADDVSTLCKSPQYII